MLFLPITKADAKQRMVYGVAVSEIADRSGEIFDYATSKPEFEKWSLDARKMSGDKSYGNVRGMQGKVAAGKLTDIGFDDKNKAISRSQRRSLIRKSGRRSRRVSIPASRSAASTSSAGMMAS